MHSDHDSASDVEFDSLRRPEFFIVGAVRSGTTAMSVYLREHPRIVMSTPKETNYFATDFPKMRVVSSLGEYLKLFQGATAETVAAGEASPCYLYSSTAIENIKQFNPQAKLIVMVRNPIDVVHSFHSRMLFDRFEDQDFERAIALQTTRRDGQQLPKRCKEPALLQYTEIGKLGAQLERLLGVFPRAQVKIIVYDDFRESPKAAYEDVLSFLGVPSDGRAAFPVVNARKTHRRRWLGTALNGAPRSVRQIWRAAKRLIGVERVPILDALKARNVERRPPQPLEPRLRGALAREFQDDVKQLSEILARDLSHWPG